MYLKELNLITIDKMLNWIECNSYEDIDLLIFLGSGLVTHLGEENFIKKDTKTTWSSFFNGKYQVVNKSSTFDQMTLEKEKYNSYIKKINKSYIENKDNNELFREFIWCICNFIRATSGSAEFLNRLIFITTNHCETIEKHFGINKVYTINDISNNMIMDDNKILFKIHSRINQNTLKEEYISHMDDYNDFFANKSYDQIIKCDVFNRGSKEKDIRKIIILFGCGLSENHINSFLYKIKNNNSIIVIIRPNIFDFENSTFHDAENFILESINNHSIYNLFVDEYDKVEKDFCNNELFNLFFDRVDNYGFANPESLDALKNETNISGAIQINIQNYYNLDINNKLRVLEWFKKTKRYTTLNKIFNIAFSDEEYLWFIDNFNSLKTIFCTSSNEINVDKLLHYLIIDNDNKKTKKLFSFIKENKDKNLYKRIGEATNGSYFLKNVSNIELKDEEEIKIIIEILYSFVLTQREKLNINFQCKLSETSIKNILIKSVSFLRKKYKTLISFSYKFINLFKVLFSLDRTNTLEALLKSKIITNKKDITSMYCIEGLADDLSNEIINSQLIKKKIFNNNDEDISNFIEKHKKLNHDFNDYSEFKSASSIDELSFKSDIEKNEFERIINDLDVEKFINYAKKDEDEKDGFKLFFIEDAQRIMTSNFFKEAFIQKRIDIFLEVIDIINIEENINLSKWFSWTSFYENFMSLLKLDDIFSKNIISYLTKLNCIFNKFDIKWLYFPRFSPIIDDLQKRGDDEYIKLVNCFTKNNLDIILNTFIQSYYISDNILLFFSSIDHKKPLINLLVKLNNNSFLYTIEKTILNKNKEILINLYMNYQKEKIDYNYELWYLVAYLKYSHEHDFPEKIEIEKINNKSMFSFIEFISKNSKEKDRANIFFFYEKYLLTIYLCDKETFYDNFFFNEKNINFMAENRYFPFLSKYIYSIYNDNDFFGVQFSNQMKEYIMKIIYPDSTFRNPKEYLDLCNNILKSKHKPNPHNSLVEKCFSKLEDNLYYYEKGLKSLDDNLKISIIYLITSMKLSRSKIDIRWKSNLYEFIASESRKDSILDNFLENFNSFINEILKIKK